MTAAPDGWDLAPQPLPAIRRRLFLRRRVTERADHYRDLARRYLRLAASTETPNHYLRIAVQYNALAEADEGVLVPSTPEGHGVFTSSRPVGPMVLSASYAR